MGPWVTGILLKAILISDDHEMLEIHGWTKESLIGTIESYIEDKGWTIEAGRFGDTIEITYPDGIRQDLRYIDNKWVVV